MPALRIDKKLIKEGMSLLFQIRREVRASNNEKRAVKREERAAESHTIRTKKHFGRDI